MATQTPNFNFDLRESADIFNPLSTNANFESLDTILKNLQETGGITTYTTTASANLLKLSGTPKVNDTVFKFVAAGDANTWTAATGGVINKIVGLDGVQKKISGGSMYVAWVNAANSMVVVAWPDVVNAQTFDGKGPNEWATKAQLDTVNQTAANATQTAQAAQTVANNALAVAQAAGFTLATLWKNNSPDAAFAGQTITLNDSLSNYKLILFEFKGTRDSSQAFITFLVSVANLKTFHNTAIKEIGSLSYMCSRAVTYASDTTLTFGGGKYGLWGNDRINSDDDWMHPMTIYGIK